MVNGTTSNKSVATSDNIQDKYLTFILNGTEYAISIQYVVDIINYQSITPVPNCPDYLCGVTNLRGKVIPIMDMNVRFGRPAREYHERTCIVVVEYSEYTVGLIVDSVREVLSLPAAQIAPPPKYGTAVENRYVLGIASPSAGSVKLILDCGAVLGDELSGTGTPAQPAG